jgi:MFS family permease
MSVSANAAAPRAGVITSLRNVAALIAAVLILQAGQGLLNVHLPLAFESAGYSRTSLGFVAAAYSAGFMAGAWYGPVLLARVGHIRVFSACAAIVAVTTLGLHGADHLIVWFGLRAIAGGAVAMMFAAVESWMSSSIAKHERGSVMGFYQVGTKAVLAAAPFLAMGYVASAPEPWMLAAAAMALAMVPVCFTSKSEPAPPKAQTLSVREQFVTAPAAVIGAFGAGITNAGVLALAPLYASAHYGAASATSFYAAAWIGSLLLQWPAGRFSDRVDRRAVIAGLTTLAAVAAFALALMGGHAPLWVATLTFGLWGAGALSFYGIAVAHMADRAEPSRMAQATSGLLFVWAAGSVIGPALQGVTGDLLGPEGVFWFAGVAAVGITGAMFWRSAARAEPTQKENFSVNQATSTAATESAFDKE